MNQKKATEAAADALKALWNADDTATWMLADPDAFFARAADVALQAAHDANIADRPIEAKTKSGKPITIRFWDRGAIITRFDENGLPHEAYVSRYKTDEWEIYVPVDKQRADKSGDVEAFRLMEDFAALAAKGVDVTTMPVSPRHTLRRAAP
jgi:hypothetical protein